ncbi:hypothetical protein [Mycolicibacterium tusciae]|uniref:hypothetical protein n=1 Tax=Mycolicibacterium tusciae TaxID=75922 RepID=UPI00024A43BC|nr:hypothetical protein [Mycolicibacterium tusciae]
MSTFVKWSRDVADFLGRDALITVSRTSKDYNCFSCGQPGKATRERTNVVVVTGDGPPVIKFAHGRCMQSQVISTTLPISARTDWERGEDVTSLQLLWPTPSGYSAGLVIDRSSGVTALHRTGDVEDLWTQMLLEQGFDLLLETGQPCPVVNTCAIELDTAGRGRVLLNDKAHPGQQLVLLDHLPDNLPDWTQAAFDVGAVWIFAGDVGLQDDASQGAAALLAEAISKGSLVGATVPVVHAS